jgi:hypothetical protein
MGTAVVVALVIGSPLTFGAIALRYASDEWLRDLAVWARALGRLI